MSESAEKKITVSRTYHKQNAGSAEEVEVAVFATTPASVHCTLSKTIQAGQYEPLQLRVGVTLPCYKEEVNDAMQSACEYAQKVLLYQISQLPPFLASLDREVCRVKNS